MSAVEPPPVTSLPLRDPPRRRPRLKKLRLLFVLSGIAVLALVSTVFGMMMAVSSDLPALESDPQYQNARNSTLVDVHNRSLGLLVSNQNRVLVRYRDISLPMREAIIAVEDRRFYTNSGVDLRGIGRAFVQDVVHSGPTQGGSTITQQFVKVALAAQDRRTVFQKMREAALAYHLTRKWSKEKILTEYLNAIYFGNGAYGIESAARTYFRNDLRDPRCGEHGHRMCASYLNPVQAAMIAGIVANPTAYDPLYRPRASVDRRNVVLKLMLDQGFIDRAEYELGRDESPPTVEPPFDDSRAPYFTSWIRQQLVDRYDAHTAFEGGLKVRTTLDLDLQQAAQQAVDELLPDPSGPAAAMVVIDNDSGEVRAMVGGRARDGQQFATTPFNLATQGQRQPGSAFKPFVLAAALKKGISPTSVWSSRKKTFDVPGTNGREKFTVNNYEGNYVGRTTLTDATITSDNSVYAEVGYHTGFARIARMARELGIRTHVSTNPAIALGGLGDQGVTVLDMAHAYETLATGGLRVSGSLGTRRDGPVGIRTVEDPKGKAIGENRRRTARVLSRKLTAMEVPILRGVVRWGTGKAASIPGVAVAGKTGTTENYGDAWFVGFTDKLTVAVWVGYPDQTKPMKTEFRGKPVAGGTYPALIWKAFATRAIELDEDRRARALAKQGKNPDGTPITTSTSTTTTTSPTTDTSTAPATGGRSRTATTPAGDAGTLTSTTPATTTPPATTDPSAAGTGGAGPD